MKHLVSCFKCGFQMFWRKGVSPPKECPICGYDKSLAYIYVEDQKRSQEKKVVE